MTSAVAVLQSLHDRGVTITVSPGTDKFYCLPKSKLTGSLREGIRKHRAERFSPGPRWSNAAGYLPGDEAGSAGGSAAAPPEKSTLGVALASSATSKYSAGSTPASLENIRPNSLRV